MDPYYLISIVAAAAALGLAWWLVRRQGTVDRPEQPADRLDTLAAWPPEPTRILRSQERLAFSTLKLALPGYMILAQVPIARFISVPKRNSYAEWMRRLGSQCVDFVICDVTSQVVAVVEIRPPAEQIGDKLRVRLDRLARTLDAAGIPVHVWNEERMPTIEAARSKILPNAPAVPPGLNRRSAAAPVQVLETADAGFVPAAATAREGVDVIEDGAPESAVTVEGPAVDPFADTDRDWTQGEIIEVKEPAGSTWFDELEESVSPVLPAQRR
ncbi:MAG TPA: DUF2726 domain-containing protein [Caldimonas sp.]|nr:DUF2726 domain-containing protein [Caldimonas sp.]